MILFGVPLLNLLWWVWADSRLKSVLPRPVKWRLALAGFMAVQLGVYAVAIATRALNLAVEVPLLPLSAAYLWHLLVLPLTVAVLGVVFASKAVRSVARNVIAWMRRNDANSSAEPVHSDSAPQAQSTELRLSRRQLLTAAAVAAPPLLVTGGVARALPRLDDFRIRTLELRLEGLPRALEGVTIAHISDVHVGRYSDEHLLRRIAEKTNALRSDLIVLTGDLIDHDLADLPAALEMVRQLDARHGVFMCEGNHDLFESRELFEGGVKAAGVPLLLNEAADLRIREHPFQILGLKWGRPGSRRKAAYIEHLADTLSLRDPDAFPVLLAHHPHTFDAAAAAGLPLTLAGHTHGGQIMLNRRVGMAPAAFKYWSGPYRRGPSSLVVSNGVGNWFPLRVNAPAEVIHLTLRAG